MPTCSVLTCQTRAGGMHRFPEDAAVRQQWIKFCGRGTGWLPMAASKVYTLHFLPADLTVSGRVKHKRVPQLLGPKRSNLSLTGSYLAKSNRSFSQVPLSAFFGTLQWLFLQVFRIRIVVIWIRRDPHLWIRILLFIFQWLFSRCQQIITFASVFNYES